MRWVVIKSKFEVFFSSELQGVPNSYVGAHTHTHPTSTTPFQGV